MYCSLNDLVSRFDLDELIQLTDSSGTGIIDAQVVDAAIKDASDTIDGYVAGRYPLPLAVVPSALTRICANIARYNLYDQSVTQVVQNNYNDALKFLTEVARGGIRLGLSVDNEPAETDSVIVMESGGSVFNRNDSKGFI
jgi:phage gp36-like protein